MTTIHPPRAPRELKMATIQVATAQVLQTRSNHYFLPDVEAELAQDDHEAWTAVCTILIAIVTVGLLLGIGAVLLAI